MSKAQGPLEARNIGVRIGEIQILHDISFSLYPGEICALIGPSGAGKSTLIKVLLGLRTASSGSALLAQAPVSNAEQVGYVPQDDALHRSLSVSQALEFAAELWLHHISKEKRQERIALITKQLGLEERLDVRIKSLSGGQRKRVSVALELLHQPQFLVLDEPTSGLDPGLEAKMMSLFAEVAKKGRILMVATHAMQSLNLCDAVMILMKGRLLFFGSPSQAKEHFAVRSFAGIFEILPEKTPEEWAQKWMTSSLRSNFAQRPPPVIAASKDQENAPTDPTTPEPTIDTQPSMQDAPLPTDREARLAALRARRKK